MGMHAHKDRASVEGFDELWQEPESVDQISKQIKSILKVLVDERIELKNEHGIAEELKRHIASLETQIQKLSWQLGQRESELSTLHTEMRKVKTEKELLENNLNKNNDLIKENCEIRQLANELSNQILQEKSKNELLVELLKELKQPDLAKISKKLGL